MPYSAETTALVQLHELEQKQLDELKSLIKCVQSGQKSAHNKQEIRQRAYALMEEGINLRGLLCAKELQVVEGFAEVALPNPKPRQ